MRIQEALDRYLLQLRADGRSSHTIGQARRHVRLLARWLDEVGHGGIVDQVGHEDVARFLASSAVLYRADGKPRKATSANALRSSLRAFFAFVRAAGYAPANAARLVRRAIVGEKVPRALSEAEEARLRAALEEARTPYERRDRALILLMLGTGIRIGSALGLSVEDVDLEARELRLRTVKRGGQRTAFLAESLVPVLRELAGDRRAGALFVGLRRGPMSYRQAQRRVAAWMQRAGIGRAGSAHTLRHSFAMRVYRRTCDLLVVKQALGHASIASTVVYAVCPEQRLRAVVDAIGR